MSLFLAFLSLCVVSAFLMAWYLHFAWSFMFAAFVFVGGYGFFIWWRREQFHAIKVHVGNHFALALACRAINL